MKVIKLDLAGCKNLWEMHEKIRIAFEFPAWYGKNWSAFWDLLWSECDADKVVITGEHTLPKELEKHLVKMHEILDRNVNFRKEYNLNAFSYEIVDQGTEHK
mgnify:CR=1 FL=1